MNTAKVEPGSNVAVFGLGGIGLNVIQGARIVGSDKIIGVDVKSRQARTRRTIRHDGLHQSKRSRRCCRSDHRPDDGGVDYSFECIGNVEVIETSTRVLSQRLGREHHHRRCRCWTGNKHAPIPASQLAGCGGVPRLVALKGAPKCRKSWTGTWTARSTSTISSPTPCPLSDINDAFDLMHSGESIRSVVTF